MKSIAFTSLLLLIVCVALTPLTSADNDGPSANGSFSFALEDGQAKFLEFNAREQNNGRVVGEMSFTDPNASLVVDPDASGNTPATGVSMRARFDCLKIADNRAVMSGVIFESNVFSAIGLRAAAFSTILMHLSPGIRIWRSCLQTATRSTGVSTTTRSIACSRLPDGNAINRRTARPGLINLAAPT